MISRIKTANLETNNIFWISNKHTSIGCPLQLYFFSVFLTSTLIVINTDTTTFEYAYSLQNIFTTLTNFSLRSTMKHT